MSNDRGVFTLGHSPDPDDAFMFYAMAENKIDIKLTESWAMHPGASVSGLYFSHPDAKYFGVGEIARDQVADYATRRNEPISSIEKRLGPNLGYEP